MRKSIVNVVEYSVQYMTADGSFRQIEQFEDIKIDLIRISQARNREFISVYSFPPTFIGSFSNFHPVNLLSNFLSPLPVPSFKPERV